MTPETTAGWILLALLLAAAALSFWVGFVWDDVQHESARHDTTRH